ncbi:MAG: MATE family efflux transporter [Erysipelotrichaceae bacterium]|nr:MATE family efflux transporter [Erysipelotrichaceae bacterium]MDY5252151.1 MATE family efflux transporter [Erysipelotrichaceae bacterium]
MDHKLAQNFNLKSLLSFVFPTIILMIFLSSYTSIDGAFVSNVINEDALAAINIVYPFINLVFATGLMFATGSNAIISSSLGAKKQEMARSFFSLIYIVGVISGLLLTLAGYAFKEELLLFLGANENLYGYANEYMSYLLPFAALSILQMFSQYFFVTEGKTKTSLIVSIIGGLANIVLDYVFMVVFKWGIKGAALATGIGYSIPALYSVYFFARNQKGVLYFVKPHFDGKNLLYSMFNGSSELINNVSLAITTLLFNLKMLEYVGNKGVSAITAILYLQFLQSAIYFGYVQGIAPIISYKYGADDKKQLKYIVNLSIKLSLLIGAFIICFTILTQDFLVSIFIAKNSEVFAFTKHGLMIVTSSFVFMGLNIFFSALFTSFGNGKVSAILSFFRTFVFTIGALLILPNFFDVNGVWLSIPVAEMLSFVMGIYYYLVYRNVYHY